MKENAAEACATQCKDEASALQSGKEKLDEAKLREMYDECYTKCVAEETKEVAEERESVSPAHPLALAWHMDMLRSGQQPECRRMQSQASKPPHMSLPCSLSEKQQ